MEIELNSKKPRGLRCRLEKIWVWDELEVDGRAGGEDGGEVQPGSSSSGAAAEMDERMWCKLPAHLLESHILVRLPLESLFRFRSVCSSWNRLIFSDEFLSRYYGLVSSAPNR